jgi:hypothetical protein
MIEKINLNNILIFLDIETVPETEDFNSLDSELQELWQQKKNVHQQR